MPQKSVSVNLKDPLVKQFIQDKVGEDGFQVLNALGRGKTDETISKQTKMRVNDIRAVLNRLHYIGVIKYSKKKAKQSNWYTYTWFIRKERILELLQEKYSEELNKLEDQLKLTKNYVFFKCTNGCDKLPFELAFEYNFKCPECGHEMEQMNNLKDKKKIEKKIKQIRTVLEVQ